MTNEQKSRILAAIAENRKNYASDAKHAVALGVSASVYSNIKKGDTVYVLSGEDKGQQGRVLSVQAAKNRAIVEGINIVSKSTKPTAKHPQGGIVKMEAPINISNLALIDPKSGKPTRVGIRVNEKGEKVRYAKKSGEEIK